MSTPDNGVGVKTLAIRLEPDMHAQLSLIAQLRGSTITAEIREAIEAHIVSIKASPELASKADGVLDDIEREAEGRRAAIASLFGAGTPAATAPRGRSSRKAGTDA